MVYRRGNSKLAWKRSLRKRSTWKRGIALLGVLLVGMSIGQQLGWMCPHAMAEVTNSKWCDFSATVGEQHESSSAGVHLCRCRLHAAQALADAEHAATDRHPACPCPQDCWCHQAPQPWELPRLVAAPVELAPLALLPLPGMLQIAATEPRLLAWDVSNSAPPGTSLLRCAELCRFLI